MELLIPGLILVGLMVYASTRIKRSAARAYESEIVETDEFSINKADGFLSVVSPENGLLFRAYSKEFAQEDASAFRRAEATISRQQGSDLAVVIKGIKAASIDTLAETASNIGDARTRNIELLTQRDGVRFVTFHRLIEKRGQVFDLRIDVAEQHREDFQQAAREMADSFEIKD